MHRLGHDLQRRDMHALAVARDRRQAQHVARMRDRRRIAASRGLPHIVDHASASHTGIGPLVVGEIGGADRVRQLHQRLLDIHDQRVVDFGGIGRAQPGRDRGRDLLHRRQAAGGVPLRQGAEMGLDAVELEDDRPRIVWIEHDEIDHRRQRRDHHIALPIADLAVGKLQQHVEAAVRRVRSPRKQRTRRQVKSARSMRRPSSRKRQPASWVMFSWARPDNDEMMRSAASTRSAMALSEGPDRQRRGDHGGEIVDRPPRIRRETVADDRSRRARGAGRDTAASLPDRRV